MVSHGDVWCGMTWQLRRVLARRGELWRGDVRRGDVVLGAVWYGMAVTVRGLGLVSQGESGHGLIWHGRHGKCQRKEQNHMVYQWSGFSYKVPAQKVGEELERLEAENGEITKEMIVDAARPTGSVMHSIFEWNDAKAGEMWRKQQAKVMLSALHILVETQDEEQEPQQISIRAYSNVKDDCGAIKAQYMNTPAAMNNARETLIKNAARELEEFTRKYRTLTEMADVIAAIDSWREEYYADTL